MDPHLHDAHHSPETAAHTKGHGFVDRLRFAVNGFYAALRREKSLRIQCAAMVAVAIVLTVTRAAPLWWALAALASGLVIAAELANTALEILADRVHPTLNPQIRAAKDVSAAAVLAAAIAALVVAGAFVVAMR